MFACTEILFNHESPLRPVRLVTQKIISTAKRISQGSGEVLELGRLGISRDWGWAPEYVEAMWLMLQRESAEDFVIATGEANTLEQFVSTVFEEFGMDWKVHVSQNSDFMRPTDLLISYGNATKAKTKLGWQAKYKMRDIIKKK